MLNKILILLLILSAGVIGFMSYDSYQDYKNDRQVEAQKIAVEREKEIVKQNKQAERVQAELELLKSECQKGIELYKTIPVKDQPKYPKPVCSYEEVE